MRHLTFHLLLRSLRNRRLRVAVAVAAMVLGGSLVTTLLTVSGGIGTKAGSELRAYGANLVISPGSPQLTAGIGGMASTVLPSEELLGAAQLAALANPRWQAEILALAPYLSGTATANSAGTALASGRQVTVVGADFASTREVSPWWKVTGAWPSANTPSDALLGQDLAEAWQVKPGDPLLLSTDGRRLSVRVAGVVETGSIEDGELFLPLEAAQTLLGHPGQVSRVEISARPEGRSLSRLAEDLQASVGGRVMVVGQIAEAEATVLRKTTLLLALVALAVVITAALAVASTMTASVLERTREVGLMKALGAEDLTVALLFLAEGGLVGALGGLAGFVGGRALAAAIGGHVFDTVLPPRLVALPAAFAVCLLVSLLATAFPVRRALAIDPILALAGD